MEEDIFAAWGFQPVNKVNDVNEVNDVNPVPTASIEATADSLSDAANWPARMEMARERGKGVALGHCVPRPEPWNE